MGDKVKSIHEPNLDDGHSPGRANRPACGSVSISLKALSHRRVLGTALLYRFLALKMTHKASSSMSYGNGRLIPR